MGPWILAQERMVMAKQTKTDYRSARTGRFITEKTAEAKPNESVKEKNPIGKKPKG